LPPAHRYSFVYVVCAATFLILLFTGWHIANVDSDSNTRSHWPFFAGVCVAFISIMATSWSQWRTSSVQHALTALQNLRTDADYIKYASIVQAKVGTFGEELDETLVKEVLKRKPSENLDEPGFYEASAFLLNQYEFIAASARLGAMDMALLETTAKGIICSLTRTYAPVIRQIRSEQITTFENLVWLYREFTDDWKTDFGDFSTPWNYLRT